jgi:hypothetical protein
MEKETQEVTTLVSVEKGYEIHRGDIIALEAVQHVKLSPGARVVRHLPDGGQELVP